nr:MAG TPA: Protein of unknown function (DUF2852) [Caudoviricetes sp.]
MLPGGLGTRNPLTSSPFLVRGFLLSWPAGL